jgi:mannitol-1-/sugar-/sorbitol-6-phosphatase
MNSLQVRGILFDLDGVLIDSTPCVTRVWREWAIEHGLDPDYVIHVAHGRRSIETIQMVAPDLNPETENQEVERRELNDTDGIVVFRGAADLLRSLPSDSWTIVTSGTRALATKRMQVAGLPVPKTFVSADDVTVGKPNPEPYLKGAQCLELKPGSCLVFEDAPSRIRAAHAAGMKVLAVPTTYAPEELREADVLLRALAQVRVAAITNDGNRHLEVTW